MLPCIYLGLLASSELMNMVIPGSLDSLFPLKSIKNNLPNPNKGVNSKMLYLCLTELFTFSHPGEYQYVAHLRQGSLLVCIDGLCKLNIDI